ncbi:hypothetical protein [Corynebacterium mastitidis]|uniref:hypothetical protein n=1 Tax=Corynebacterium mastitidis TaxID=161890 RepID=UPI0030E7CD2C
MKGLKLWWGLMDKSEAFFWLFAVFFWPVILLGEVIEDWWSFTLVLFIVFAVAKKNVRLNAGYAALNLPRSTWRRHQRCDVLINLAACLFGLSWALPWGSWQQIVLMAVAVLSSLRAILGRKAYPAGSYVGESLEERTRSVEASGDGRDGRTKGISYPETLFVQSILVPQLRVWLGWVAAAAFFAVCVALASVLLDTSGGMTLILILATGAAIFTVMDGTQRSYGEWIRFGGHRAVWARWTGLISLLPVVASVLIGGFLGFANGSGWIAGMSGGLTYILLILPVILVSTIGESSNIGWCLLLLVGMVIGGSLFIAQVIERTEWFLLQGGLVALLLLCLPVLVRGTGHNLTGAARFFGVSKENAEQT